MIHLAFHVLRAPSAGERDILGVLRGVLPCKSTLVLYPIVGVPTSLHSLPL